MNIRNLSVIPHFNYCVLTKKDALSKEANLILKQIKGCISVNSLISTLKTKKTLELTDYKIVSILIELEKQGYISLRFEYKSPQIKELYESLNKVEDICKKNPGFWNIVAGEREW